MYKHWFVSRQKRRLTTILEALTAFSDVCVGQVWSGNTELQLKLEDELGNRSITGHGKLRARKVKQGGGGIRTLFKQMRDLGLVFTEDDSGKCRLTLVGEAWVKGDITFVDAMRMQLQKYQYPSATSWSGSGSIDHRFKIHPFQFMFRLLRDPRMEGFLTEEEMRGIVIHYADSDSQKCLDRVIGLILQCRAEEQTGILPPEFVPDDKNKTFYNIANTFFNYAALCQYTDKGPRMIRVRTGKEADIDKFVQENPKFISNPEMQENYIRAYGRGTAAKDLRDFEKTSDLSQKELNEARMRREYVLLALKTPITGITPDIVQSISKTTGIDEKTVKHFLVNAYPNGNTDDFFVNYKELAHMSREGATDFELATVEMFRKIFQMKAEHIGPIGNTPDVFVESDTDNYCGIIDNKAYKNGYCINGPHLRVMEDEYIPNYQKYGHTDKPLAFYSYIAGTFGDNMNSWLSRITKDTGIAGSAMPVDLLIDFAQDYHDKHYTHADIRRVFSVGREVQLSDVG